MFILSRGVLAPILFVFVSVCSVGRVAQHGMRVCCTERAEGANGGGGGGVVDDEEEMHRERGSGHDSASPQNPQICPGRRTPSCTNEGHRGDDTKDAEINPAAGPLMRDLGQ